MRSSASFNRTSPRPARSTASTLPLEDFAALECLVALVAHFGVRPFQVRVQSFALRESFPRALVIGSGLGGARPQALRCASSSCRSSRDVLAPTAAVPMPSVAGLAGLRHPDRQASAQALIAVFAARNRPDLEQPFRRLLGD
jgi:hypothetical protein